jgi:NADH:ubiquinone oxidoreductase subunit 6 (subunit J)
MGILKLLLFLAFFIFTVSIPSFAVFFILLYFLIISFFIYSLNLPFLAFIILIVYVGAIAMLFVFCTMLFERNTPFRGYFTFRRLSIYPIFVFFIFGFFKFFSNLFTSSNTEQILFDLKYVANSKVKVHFVNDTTFLEIFASFFFATDKGLFYTTFIGFMLFFFTVAVTYIFYFTKKIN